MHRLAGGELPLSLKVMNSLSLKFSITMETDMLKNPHPSHPGAILSEVYLSQLGWSQTKLAEELGCAHRKINEIINGKRSISPDFALDLEKTHLDLNESRSIDIFQVNLLVHIWEED